MTCKLYFGMGQTLVLNASYEPLNITSWRRAVILMIKGKAIETNVRQLRSKLSKNCQFMAVVKADAVSYTHLRAHET